MVVPPLKKVAWIVASVCAIAYLVGMALSGMRKNSGIADFTASGPMRDILVADVTDVDVRKAGRKLSFHRTPQGAWTRKGANVAAAVERQLSEGLKLLHNSGPMGTLPASEMKPDAKDQHGLQHPDLEVDVRTKGGRTFGIRFGAANVVGTARFAQAKGHADVILLPDYVAQTWDDLARVK